MELQNYPKEKNPKIVCLMKMKLKENKNSQINNNFNIWRIDMIGKGRKCNDNDKKSWTQKQWNMGKEKQKYWVLTCEIILRKWTPNKVPPHNVLIWKLQNIGGLNEKLKLDESYSRGREMRNVVNDVKSKRRKKTVE